MSHQPAQQSRESCYQVSKVLRSASVQPTIKYSDIMPKSPPRVLTCEECCQELNEKQRKKAEGLKQKEIRKAIRERKKEGKMKELEKHKELKKAKETSQFNIT